MMQSFYRSANSTRTYTLDDKDLPEYYWPDLSANRQKHNARCAMERGFNAAAADWWVNGGKKRMNPYRIDAMRTAWEVGYAHAQTHWTDDVKGHEGTRQDGTHPGEQDRGTPTTHSK